VFGYPEHEPGKTPFPANPLLPEDRRLLPGQAGAEQDLAAALPPGAFKGASPLPPPPPPPPPLTLPPPAPRAPSAVSPLRVLQLSGNNVRAAGAIALCAFLALPDCKVGALANPTALTLTDCRLPTADCRLPTAD
jgi:hypothetical protein